MARLEKQGLTADDVDHRQSDASKIMIAWMARKFAIGSEEDSQTHLVLDQSTESREALADDLQNGLFISTLLHFHASSIADVLADDVESFGYVPSHWMVNQRLMVHKKRYWKSDHEFCRSYQTCLRSQRTPRTPLLQPKCVEPLAIHRNGEH